uniref:Sirtuin 4 n=1 Tax=Eptatretus burgeri TaxID=7764 RepID=A0A8C4N875_EPTBU
MWDHSRLLYLSRRLSLVESVRYWHCQANRPTLPFVPTCSGACPEDVEQLKRYVQQCQRLFVITGAGISTESGIPDYRSEHVGLFARTQRRPVEHGMFVRSARMRQSYWARSFTGWTSFLRHLPNAAHLALSHWERAGRLHWLVTQNVDALHRKSGSLRCTELHGCLYLVICLNCGQVTHREQLQKRMVVMNPHWQVDALEVAPDGDVLLSESQVENFRVPACLACEGILKPQVTFFGDNVDRATVAFLYKKLAESDGILIAGSSLQVYSAYRFVREAHDQGLPIAILNIGPTRANTLAMLTINARCGDVLPLALDI